jgi:glycosyltransferase involved in cell wall biosynthesis
MGKKKILHVVHRSWPYLGGAERLFWEWAKSSRDAGYDVTIFTTDVWDIEYFHDRSKRRIEILEEEVEGIKIKRFRIVSFSSMLRRGMFKILPNIPFQFWSYAFGYPHIFLPGYLWRMIFTREKFDLVNAGVFPHLFLTYPALQYARRMKIPAVCTPLVHLGEPHDSDGTSHFLSARHVKLLQHFDKIATMTHIEKEAVVERGVDGKKIHVIGAGVTPDEICGGRGARFREKYGVRGKIVLQISTQTYDKGSLHLIEAMKLLWQRGIEATLVLIGQVMNDFDAYFFRQPSWVYEKVIVLDYIDEETKKDVLDACSVFVMPSRAESFGIVYLEAWLYQKPVIGAYAGALPEMIQDGKDGFLVPFSDIHMLFEYVRILLVHPPLAEAMGRYGYQKVLRQYTWDRSCDKIQTLYEELLPHGKDQNRNRYQPND